jgi:hypothetical protein
MHAALRSTGSLTKAGFAAEIDPEVLEVKGGSSSSSSSSIGGLASLQPGMH